MVIVVEGPSAAGKTAWIRKRAHEVAVAELMPEAVHASDLEGAARSWAEHASIRWAAALETERRAGMAVCDTDPLKLHYAWSRWRIGAGSEIEFLRQAVAYRDAVARGRLGFADAWLVSIPDGATLTERKTCDRTRRRRNFDLHVRLGEPLREWYGMVESIRPGDRRPSAAARRRRCVRCARRPGPAARQDGSLRRERRPARR